MSPQTGFDKEINPLDAASHFILAETLRGRERALVDAALPAGAKLLVADPQTLEALGSRILSVLAQTQLHLLAAAPRPTVEQADRLASAAENHVALIAIGSGTINDVTKFAAFKAGKPYVVFPTAPSMNGYVSPNASMIVDGERTSLAARAPVAVFADLEILANAPKRLILSGLGDSLCRSTAQADWLLSHHLLGTAYDLRPFELLKPYEEALFDAAGSLTQGDLGAIELLMRTLIASGQGMRLAGGSYPASQGEHMIAHTLEMMGHTGGYHGEEIGVTTLTMAKRQEDFLSGPVPELIPDEPPDSFYAQLGTGLGKTLLHSARRKFRQRATIPLPSPSRWQEVVRLILPYHQKTATLRAVLLAAGAPTEPGDLKLDAEVYAEACHLAPWTRDRFTFMDLQ